MALFNSQNSECQDIDPPIFLKSNQAQSKWIYTHKIKQLEMASLGQGPGSPHKTFAHPVPPSAKHH